MRGSIWVAGKIVAIGGFPTDLSVVQSHLWIHFAHQYIKNRANTLLPYQRREVNLEMPRFDFDITHCRSGDIRKVGLSNG